MSGHHFLIVHEVPEDGMDIEHPADCPTEGIFGGSVRAHVCDVGGLVNEFGIDEWFRRAGETNRVRDDREVVSIGRHQVEAWLQRIDCPTYGSTEYDAGLCLSKGGAS